MVAVCLLIAWEALLFASNLFLFSPGLNPNSNVQLGMLLAWCRVLFVAGSSLSLLALFILNHKTPIDFGSRGLIAPASTLALAGGGFGGCLSAGWLLGNAPVSVMPLSFFGAGIGNGLLFTVIFHACACRMGKAVRLPMLMAFTLAMVLFFIVNQLGSRITACMLIILPLAICIVLCAQLKTAVHDTQSARLPGTDNDNDYDSRDVFNRILKLVSKRRTVLMSAVVWLTFGLSWTFTLALDGSRSLLQPNAYYGFIISGVGAITGLILVAATRHTEGIAQTFWLSIPFLLLGICMVIATGSRHFALSFALIIAALLTARVQLSIHLAELLSDNRADMGLFLGCRSLLFAAEALGGVLGIHSVHAESTLFSYTLVIAANILVIVTIFMMSRIGAVVRRNESQTMRAEMRVLEQQVAQLRQRVQEQKKADIIHAQSTQLAANYSLTKREREICNLYLHGYDTIAIAEDLCISRSTVQTHTKHIYEKLGVNSRRELVTLAETYRRDHH